MTPPPQATVTGSPDPATSPGGLLQNRRELGRLLAVCAVHALIPDVGGSLETTAIDKRRVDGPVEVHTLGVAGDRQVDTRHHGGDGQAVYAYAEEDADWWAAELDRHLPAGRFGENLRTSGLDVTGALLGELWRVGTTLLEVSAPRIPCVSFQGFWGVPQLVKRFTEHGAPGAYLRVLTEGRVEAGDAIEIVHRPDHNATIGVALRALTVERALVTRLGPALGVLPDRSRAKIAEMIERAS